MPQVEEMLGNSFEELGHPFTTAKKERSPSTSFQLLDYDNVLNLNDVMETTVPIDGKGNFPSLEVTPSALVQMVRDGLSKEGIRVPNVRLNGSAATHVLSRGGTHPYKDLDLIFAVDASEYTDRCTCGGLDMNNNINNNNTYCRTKGFRYTGRKHISQRGNTKTPPSDPNPEVSNALQFEGGEESTDPEISDSKTATSNSTSCSSSPETVFEKNADFEDLEDIADKDSGYTSSGSSVSSLPVSPSGSFVHPIRSRTHSLDSSSSITSSSSGQLYYARHGRHNYSKHHTHHDTCMRSKESCWQKIKDVVMSILRELLPEGVSRTHLTDLVLTDAYVQKMVKITNDVDRWSLISLNNNAGRNLELKFVDSMRRQYEFSVDSFQVILDSYQQYKNVSKGLENLDDIKLSPNFYPSVFAESVYGDFEAALRHLHHRRICTRRPEQIRGGGLLRYCNLLVRDFTPGEVEGYEDDVCDDVTEEEDDVNPAISNQIQTSSQSYSTSRECDVRRLERLMCSRFFIDFGEFPQQQQKLLNYLESHFANEENLKFQYLLLVRRVVEKSTVCLMSNEKTLIIDFITKMARETLAKDVKSVTDNSINISHPPGPMQTKVQPKMQSPYSMYRANHCSVSQYQPPQNTFQRQIYQSNQWVHNTNNSNNFTPQYSHPTVNTTPSGYPPQNYCVNQNPCCYPPHQSYTPNVYPQYVPHQQGSVPLAICPSCQSTYSQPQSNPAYCTDNSSNPQVIVTPPRHTMSVDSPPFYPASQFSQNVLNNAPRAEVVRLSENAKLFYNAAPISNLETSNLNETSVDNIPIPSDCEAQSTNSDNLES